MFTFLKETSRIPLFAPLFLLKLIVLLLPSLNVASTNCTVTLKLTRAYTKLVYIIYK